MAQGWLPLAALPVSPVDLSGLSTQPSDFFGFIRLSTYPVNGNAADIACTPGGSTTTIAFSNNVINLKAIQAACGSTTFYVAKLYNQIRIGADAMASTNQPVSTPLNVVNGLRAAGFNGLNNSPIITAQMALPNSVALDITNLSMFFVGILSAAEANTAGTLVSLTNVSTIGDWRLDIGPSYVATSTQTQSAYVPSNPLVYGLNEGATPGTTFYVADRTFARAATTGTGTSAGGIVGNNVGGASRGYYEVVAFALFSSSLSSADVTALKAALIAPFPIPVQTAYSTTWAIDGDSIILGAGTTFNQNSVRQIAPLLSSPQRLINAGIYGQTLAAISTGGPSRFAQFKGWNGSNLGYIVENSTNDFTSVSTNQGLSSTPTIISGGAAYAANSSFLVTVAGGTGTAAQIEVTTNGSGVVSSISYISNFGSYSVNPTTPNLPTGGTGTGLSLGLTFAQINSFAFVKANMIQLIANAKASTGTAITKVGVVTCLPRASWVSATFTGSISGTVLNVTAVASGSLAVGQSINYPGTLDIITIQSLGTGAGGTGTYNLNISELATSQTMYAGATSWVQAQLYNADLRANPSNYGLTFLIDVASDSTMGFLGNAPNTALFTDGTHPSNIGWGYIAPYYAAGMYSAYP